MESEKILITNKGFRIYDALDKIDNYLADLIIENGWTSSSSCRRDSRNAWCNGR